MENKYDSSKQPLNVREEILLSLLVEMTCYAQYHVNDLHDHDMTDMADATQKRVNHCRKHIAIASKCSSNPNILKIQSL